MEFKDKKVLVSGGSRGIGRAVAEKFASLGADVSIIYAGNKQGADECVAAVERYGGKGAAYCCDVSSFSDTLAVTKQIENDFGVPDILVNNAGIVRDGLILNMTEEDFDKVLQVNLKGAFNLIRHFSRGFIRRRSGRIINISSVVALSGNGGQANYAAAKAGLIGFTKSAAKELASRGITCNAIAPGFIDSDMTCSLASKVKGDILSGIPMRRMGTADEVANLAVFLGSDRAAYITGEVIRIDGGLGM